MTLPNIAIIGAGNIGSRHLQALALLGHTIAVWVVDPSVQSLQRAKLFYQQVAVAASAPSPKFLTAITGLPDELDAVIVATNSGIRRAVIEQLLAAKKVKHLILEKILFQNPEDYSAVEELLRAKKVSAWVNCPMRMLPFYRQLKAKLDPAAKMKYQVSASFLGIGTNAIHHLDLVAYLTDCYSFTLNGSKLSDRLLGSKRPGYVEFAGTLEARSDKAFISITSHAKGETPMLIHLATDTFHCLIRSSEHKAWIAEAGHNWSITEMNYTEPLQSQLTHLAIQQLLNSGSCELTPYSASTGLHLPLITALTEKYQSIVPGGVMACPIT
ncbi:Gfo/Idh/MocA family protein [Paenibacillus harenae]|uniref:Gfo/Idh/MocA family protein n=1 Tax=Paenibacillus harenae TaxID=306543 RepID=UPI0004108EFD|nr:Gfo/Idh/MocA family oxidoreductase [Paenibacillus harenae]